MAKGNHRQGALHAPRPAPTARPRSERQQSWSAAIAGATPPAATSCDKVASPSGLRRRGRHRRSARTATAERLATPLAARTDRAACARAPSSGTCPSSQAAAAQAPP